MYRVGTHIIVHQQKTGKFQMQLVRLSENKEPPGKFADFLVFLSLI